MTYRTLPAFCLKRAAFFLLLSATVCIWSCASSGTMDRLVPQVENREMALHYFGPPTSESTLPDGNTRYEWVLDRTIQKPGQIVVQQVRMWGRDSDGFPRYREREVFVPAHTVYQNCRMVMILDAEGKVLESVWQGNSCDELPAVPIVRQR